MRFMKALDTRFIRSGHACSAADSSACLTLLADGRNDSPLWSRSVTTDVGRVHGWLPAGEGECYGLPGLNAERPDPLAPGYLLGNGYRTYRPALGRFICPDSLSPFGAGGINPYVYCSDDPVNHTDPTGHISWQGTLGIVAGVIGLGLSLLTAGISVAAAGGIAAALEVTSAGTLIAGGSDLIADVAAIASGATEVSSKNVSATLSWVSMGLGMAGLTAGLARRFFNPRKLPEESLLTWYTQAPGPFDSYYLFDNKSEAFCRIRLELGRYEQGKDRLPIVLTFKKRFLGFSEKSFSRIKRYWSVEGNRLFHNGEALSSVPSPGLRTYDMSEASYYVHRGRKVVNADSAKLPAGINESHLKRLALKSIAGLGEETRRKVIITGNIHASEAELSEGIRALLGE